MGFSSFASFASNDAWLSIRALPDPSTQPITYLVATALLFVALYAFHDAPNSKIPLVNPYRSFEFTSSRVKKIFRTKAIEILLDRFEHHPDEPFRIHSNIGEITILPPKYANELRSDSRLDFQAFVQKLFHAHLPGFEGFRVNRHGLVEDVVRKKLTHLVSQVTVPVSAECEAAIREVFGEEAEWNEVPLTSSVLNLVARLSSRVFLGEELCRNESWLEITITYTVNAFLAAEKLHTWPRLLRPLAQWFIPECILLRKRVAEVRRLVGAVLKQREADKAAAVARGESGLDFNDAIEWFEKEAKGRDYDPAHVQLTLSMASIHTTSELLTKIMLTLAKHPDYVERLREEMIQVLGEGEWKKTSLYNLKLLDSVIKETQRHTPQGLISMQREVKSPIKLQDGMYLRRGTRFAISGHRMWDRNLYDSPEEWRGDRFLKLREKPGYEGVAQVVSTSPDHLSFGHGQHACPGRFFAANAIKIALCHLVLKYDWKLADGVVPKSRHHGFSMTSDHSVKIMMRRRVEELRIGTALG